MSEAQPIARAVLGAVPNVSALLRQLEEDGIDPSSKIGETAIRMWSEVLTGEFCGGMGWKNGKRAVCGQELSRWERMNGRCWNCTRPKYEAMCRAQAIIDKERAFAMAALRERYLRGELH